MRSLIGLNTILLATKPGMRAQVRLTLFVQSNHHQPNISTIFRKYKTFSSRLNASCLMGNHDFSAGAPTWAVAQRNRDICIQRIFNEHSRGGLLPSQALHKSNSPALAGGGSAYAAVPENLGSHPQKLWAFYRELLGFRFMSIVWQSSEPANSGGLRHAHMHSHLSCERWKWCDA